MGDEGVGENDIAIVGMALRVPGADSPDAFWRNLLDGRESIVDYSDGEMLQEGESPDALRNPAYVRRGGALEDVKRFDRGFFGFSPKEAAILDPQHRHFMELCWESLEDAGHVPNRFDGQIGLFAGCGMGSYFYFNVCSNPDLVEDVGLFLLRHTGNDKDFLATRVSYLLDLKGPSVNVQTACSTSLVATHYACQSLLSGECDLALSGGITIQFPTRVGYVYRDGEVLSPDGHCHAFDHRAQGTVLTSGGGVVALRRLEDAIGDGDEIYAVIKSSAVNNDGGQKVGYLAPSVDGQAAAMTEAYTVADIDPATIGMIECHGTGTYMGDPIEIAALTQAFRSSGSEAAEENQFCRIGSVKTNIGHLDTAAGVVGLIKASLSLRNEAIPASLGYERPNPEIGFEKTPFLVNDELTAWPAGDVVRRAAVNSLGVGGTNAHVILEEHRAASDSEPSGSTGPVLLQLAARNGASLDEGCRRLGRYLEAHPEVELKDVAHTLRHGRETFEQRRVLVAEDAEHARGLLEGLDPRRVFTHRTPEQRASLVFMFSGGGSHYPAMARGLYEGEPVFREHVDRGLAGFEQSTKTDLRAALFASDAIDRGTEFDATSRQLPAIFIVEYAMAQLWKSWGIEPALLIGHSMGENAAACVAGIIRFEDCLEWLIVRGQLMDETETGAMLAVSLPEAELIPFLGNDCDLAAVNGPSLCVASGAARSIESLSKRLEEADVDVQRVAIDRAAHSRLLDPVLDEFRRFVSRLDLSAPQIPIVSNRTGQLLTDEQAMDPEYWVEHLRREVRFSAGLETALAEPGRVLLEVGPGQSLCSFARQQPAQGPPVNIVPSIRHKADDSSDAGFFLTAIGRLWASGIDVDLDRIDEAAKAKGVRLPTYAWSHEDYFVDRVESVATSTAAASVERVEDVSRWAHVPVWVPARVPTSARGRDPQTWLLFMDRVGVGRRLEQSLLAQGHSVIRVVEGDRYAKRSEVEYTLAAELGREGYAALVKDLVSAGRSPTHIVHLWLTTQGEHFRPGSSFFHENLQNGFYSLYFLAKALGDESLPGDLQISVVSTGLQGVTEDDAPLQPEKATVLGPVMVLPREMPGVSCKSIDLVLPARTQGGWFSRLKSVGRGGAAGSDPFGDLANALEKELLAPHESSLVALRGADRFVRRFEPSHLSEREHRSRSEELPEGGVFLVTGGLGGLGLSLADRLAREIPRARLVLLGRSGLPGRETWAEIAKGVQGAQDERQAHVIRRILAMEEAGAEVEACAADVTHLDEMRAAISGIRSRFGSIDGIFHAAGTVSDELIQLKVDADIEQVFGPKIHGTQVLDALLEESGASLFVLYSSTSSIIAPAGQVDYVAANAFLDAFAQSRRDGPVRTLAINWGIWNEVGLAAKNLAGDGAESEAERTVPSSHPLLDSRARDGHDRTGFYKSFSPQRDWILDEHRTREGEALFPGAGYPELARAALSEYGTTGGFEIADLYFLRPLYVPDGEVREVRVQLEPTAGGYRFGVRTRERVEGRPAWVLTAEADLVLGREEAPAPRLDLKAIDARCQRSRSSVNPAGHRTGQDNHVRFGPRWRVLRQVLYGEGEALAHLELQDQYVEELTEFALHPPLLDLATGYAMELIEGYDPEESLWIPVSYGRLRVERPLEGKLHSWVRLREGIEDKRNFASFDVTITDAQGGVILEAEDFTIKRVEGPIRFGDEVDPKTSDVEFGSTHARSDEREFSPAERQLRRNYEAGILPEEGTDALLRLLEQETSSQVIVSSIALDVLRRQADQVTEEAGPPATRFERPDLDSEYAEPRDEVEKTLVALWEELLGVEGLGIRDSFFDLGGHSLIAVRLFSKIKKTYRVDFPISVLFEAPTIQGCAELIRDSIGEGMGDAASETVDDESVKAPRTRFKHLVAMDSGSTAGEGLSPFFLVAGMFGNVLNLRHLAALVGTDRPFYGLQARGLYGGEPPHETFEEMASAYLDEIRQVQPEGPYTIGGFSGGGITAFEMAHQLVDAGEEVSMLLLLDSLLPEEPAVSLVDRMRVQAIRLQRRGLGYLAEWARRRARWERERWTARFSSGEPDREPEEEFHNTAIERAFRAALPRYEMRPYPGHVQLFRPALDSRYILGPGRVLNEERRWVFEDNGWGQWVDSIEVVEMPGDHDSMVLEPNVRVMAARVRERFESL